MAAVTTPTATSTAPVMSPADRAAHDAASYVRTTVADCRTDYAAAQASRDWQDHRDDANVRR